MKSGVLYVNVKPDQLAEFESRWKTNLLEKVRNEPGFLSAVFFASGDGKCLSIGFWDSEQNAANFKQSKTYQDFVASVTDLLVSPPERKTYDVIGDLASITEYKKAA